MKTISEHVEEIADKIGEAKERMNAEQRAQFYAKLHVSEGKLRRFATQHREKRRGAYTMGPQRDSNGREARMFS